MSDSANIEVRKSSNKNDPAPPPNERNANTDSGAFSAPGDVTGANAPSSAAAAAAAPPAAGRFGGINMRRLSLVGPSARRLSSVFNRSENIDTTNMNLSSPAGDNDDTNHDHSGENSNTGNNNNNDNDSTNGDRKPRNNKKQRARLSVWHAPEFLKHFDTANSRSSVVSTTTDNNMAKNNEIKLSSTSTAATKTTPAGDTEAVLKPQNQQPTQQLIPRVGGGAGPGLNSTVEEKILKVLKNPLLKPIMNNEKAFDRLELNRDYVGCYLPDLALALRENTSIRHVFILEGWLVTLSVKKAKILLGIIGSIPKLKTMSIRFPTKRFYLPVSTLIHLMSPATELKRLKLWGIKLPRRRDVTMLSNTIPTLVHLQEFWIFAKGDVNLNPIIKALSTLSELKMVYINQESSANGSNTRYLTGGTYLADLCNNTPTTQLDLEHFTTSNSPGSKLEGLSLTNIVMINAQTEALFPVLANNNVTLKWLSLIDITLRGSSVQALAEMLKVNKTLNWLTLNNVGLDDDNCLVIAEALSKVKPQKKKSLKSVTTSTIMPLLRRSASGNEYTSIRQITNIMMTNSANTNSTAATSTNNNPIATNHRNNSTDSINSYGTNLSSDTSQMNNGTNKPVFNIGNNGLVKLDICRNDKITTDGYEAFIVMIEKNRASKKPFALQSIRTDAPAELQEMIDYLLAREVL